MDKQFIKDTIELYRKNTEELKNWDREKLQSLLRDCHIILTDRLCKDWDYWLSDVDIISIHHLIDMASYYQGFNKAIALTSKN